MVYDHSKYNQDKFYYRDSETENYDNLNKKYQHNDGDYYKRQSPTFYRGQGGPKGQYHQPREYYTPYPRRDTEYDDPYYRRTEDKKYSRFDDRPIKKPRVEQRGVKPKHIPGTPNLTIGIFGLPCTTTETDLRHILTEKLEGFDQYTHKLIIDERTGLCKGFCFVNFSSLNDSIRAKEIMSIESFRGNDFKCDFSYK